MSEERKELSRYTDEALARELRLRGYEVYKWDRLPEWNEPERSRAQNYENGVL